jgi:hypothetical protein
MDTTQPSGSASTNTAVRRLGSNDVSHQDCLSCRLLGWFPAILQMPLRQLTRSRHWNIRRTWRVQLHQRKHIIARKPATAAAVEEYVRIQVQAIRLGRNVSFFYRTGCISLDQGIGVSLASFMQNGRQYPTLRPIDDRQVRGQTFVGCGLSLSVLRETMLSPKLLQSDLVAAVEDRISFIALCNRA